MKELRSLSGEKLLLREFLLDQILLLQESLEPCLVPRVIEELLGSKLAAPPSSKDSPNPLAKEGTMAEGCSVVACTPSLSSGSTSMVVHEPSGTQVLPSSSQMSETRLPFVQVVLP
jgi:hypothetical protein